jgi:hypothetical protein
MLAEYEALGIVIYQKVLYPMADACVPILEFVKVLNPLAVVPKGVDKLRPVIDLTRGGVN